MTKLEEIKADFLQQINNKVNILRNEHGQTWESIAKALGTHYPVLSQILNGKRTTTLDLLYKKNELLDEILENLQ